MPEELTIGAIIAISIGVVITSIQYLIPSVEGTLLGLTKDIIMQSGGLPNAFKFMVRKVYFIKA